MAQSKTGGLKPPLYVLDLQSHIKPKDIDPDRICFYCGGQLQEVLRPWSYQYSEDSKTITLATTRALELKCLGECGGIFIPPEVTIELLDQAIGKLEKSDEWALNGLKQAKQRYQASL